MMLLFILNKWNKQALSQNLHLSYSMFVSLAARGC